MKAFVFPSYGKPLEVLKLQEIPIPEPKANEVLVKVMATAINDFDYSVVTGKPSVYKLMFGLGGPNKKYKIPGMELAGIVMQQGHNSSKFKVGDPVFGDTSDHGFGTFAQYVCIKEDALHLKPEKLSFEEAAAIPHASMLAYQGIKEIMHLKTNQNLLINGAGGGVGNFAVCIAQEFSESITGVDSEKKQHLMKNIGYTEVINYEQVDFTKTGKKYDVILDCKTNRSPFKYLRALHKNGSYISVGGKPGKLIQLLIVKLFVELFQSKRLKILALKPNLDLEFILDRIEKIPLKKIIDGPYSFDKLPWALQYFGEGLHHGKIIISIKHDD